MSPAQFEQRLRHDLALAAAGAAPSPTPRSRRAPWPSASRALEAQKREVSEARIAAQQYLAQVKIDESR